MKTGKLILALLSASMLLGAFAGCAKNGKDGKDTSGTSTDTEATVVLPKLTELTVSDGYTVGFSADTNDYQVEIPSGRPAVPQVSAKAEDGAEVKVLQAFIPDSTDNGTAVVTVTKGGNENTYNVKFVKNAAKGYILQYGDVVEYKPDYTPAEGEKITYSTSDEKALTVDKKGVVKAVGLSDGKTVITAKVGDKTVGELNVDKVIKAPLNIFLVIGQSNAYGWHDVPSNTTQGQYFKKQREQFDKPIAGTVWADDVSTSYDDANFSGMYDTCRTKGTSGFYPALGKEWYALTGEKSLMLKTAVGSTPIEAWTADPELCFYGIDLYKMTVDRFNYYKDLFAAADSTFTVNRVYAFWLQGETCEEYVYDPSVHTWDEKNGVKNYKYKGDWKGPSKDDPLMTADEYYGYFMSMYNSLVKDIGLEFIGILPVRAMTSVSSVENRKEEQLIDLVAPRAAQFALNYKENGNIAIVTLKTEVGRTEAYADKDAEGWGYLGCYNIHYNQLGYNVIGKDAALNTYNLIAAGVDRKAQDIKVLDSNGREAENGKITVKNGKTHQVSAIALPIYADGRTLTYEISDTTLCTIDEYGMITAVKNADNVGKTAELKISNGEITKTVTIEIG